MKVPAVFVSPEAILYMADGIFGNIMIHIPEDLSVGKNRLITKSKRMFFLCQWLNVRDVVSLLFLAIPIGISMM